MDITKELIAEIWLKTSEFCELRFEKGAPDKIEIWDDGTMSGIWQKYDEDISEEINPEEMNLTSGEIIHLREEEERVKREKKEARDLARRKSMERAEYQKYVNLKAKYE